MSPVRTVGLESRRAPGDDGRLGVLVSDQLQERVPFGAPTLIVGRYAVFDEFSSGGFATVHLGRAVGVGGFARTVAIKRLHRQYARDPEVSAMFLDEAKIVARIRHPNVLPTLDLIAEDEELFLVMEYVEGVPLSFLIRHAKQRKRLIPLGVALRILCGALHGLNAAHEARDERGELMNLVHRDVSPDNVLVGVDGMPRLLDFGVAKALGQFHATREGEVKGKLAYITPEQVRGDQITRRSDIFSASVVLWEAMTGERLFKAKSVAAIAHALLTQEIPPPSEIAGTPKKLDGIVLQGLERDPDKRWSSAERMAAALEAVGELASQPAVARYVRQAGGERIAERARQVAMVEAAEIDTDRFNTRSSQTDIDVSAVDLQRAKTALTARLAERANDPVPGRPDPALDEPDQRDARLPVESSPPDSAGSSLLEADQADLGGDFSPPPGLDLSTRSLGSTDPSAVDLPDDEALTPRRRRLAVPVAIAATLTIGAIVLLAASGNDTEESAASGSTGTAPLLTTATATASEAAPTPTSSTLSPDPSGQPSATPEASAAPDGSGAPSTAPPTGSFPAPPIKHTSTKPWPKPKPSGGLYGRD